MGDTDESDREQGQAALMSRLRVIEDQPLEARATAFAQIHDELRAQLDSGESSPAHA